MTTVACQQYECANHLGGYCQAVGVNLELFIGSLHDDRLRCSAYQPKPAPAPPGAGQRFVACEAWSRKCEYQYVGPTYRVLCHYAQRCAGGLLPCPDGRPFVEPKPSAASALDDFERCISQGQAAALNICEARLGFECKWRQEEALFALLLCACPNPTPARHCPAARRLVMRDGKFEKD